MGILLADKDWETINKRAGVDVMGIAINLDGRYTPMEQAGGTGKRYITSEEASCRILQDRVDKLQGTSRRRCYWD